jgi:transcriptional regulator with XRE-family HTH domain
MNKIKQEGKTIKKRGMLLNRAVARRNKDRLDKIIGTNIRVEREMRKLSREELAEMLEVTVSHMGLIERGARGATAANLEKLAYHFKISIDTFFSESDRGFLSVCEDRASSIAANHRKIASLATRLNQQESDFIIHVIQGLLKQRPINVRQDSN